MKRLMVSLMFTILWIYTFSQQTKPTRVLTKQDYLKKNRNQKTTGIIILVGGMIGASAGFGIAMQNLKGLGDPNSPPPKNEQLGDILGYSGLGLMAASLPFLISASSNKKKALGMSIEQEAAMTLYKNGLAKTAFPSISIKIAF